MDVTPEQFKNFKDQITKEINTIPQKVLDYKIKVKNGHRQTISIGEAIKQNWERTAKIANGEINLEIEDSNGYTSTWALSEIIDKLDKKPANTLNKISSLSDKFTKILKFLEAVGIFYLIYLLTR